MTVLFVLATFFLFIVLDWVLSRNRVPVVKPVIAEAPSETDGIVNGFLVPDRLRYHAGHSWLMRERRNLVRVGIDDFAARLAGTVEGIELPKPGTWIRQGQKAWTMMRNGETSAMVSPTEGEVVEINPDVVKDPSLVRKDPYGQGWLMTIHVPDEEGTTRNLVPRNLVSSWMRDAVERLYSFQPELAGAVAADAGEPVEDIAAALPHVKWSELTSEFFLTR
ncbi:MAG: glycine cleavage system protein H [Bryobacterales bacterium]|nr:glycine cleavage system protein H [Bryobacterales bacterium]